MTKHPIPENETERLNALHNYAILDSLHEDEFDRITELASLICGVPISLVSLVDENRQWFKSRVGLDVKETYRDLSFCQYAIMGTEIFEVPDATRDDRFKDNEFVVNHPDVRFYAGFPLIDPEGYALGTLCVIDHQPNKLDSKQKRSLQLLGEEVISMIVERRQKQELKNFEKIFKLSGDLICVSDSSGFLKKINPAFEKLLGWSASFLLNTTFFELIHPRDAESTKEEIEKMILNKEASCFINRLRTRSGAYKYLQWTITPELSTGYLFAIGRDITDLHQTRQMLEQTNEVARVGGWEFDFGTHKLYWTAVTKEMHGIDSQAEPGDAIEFCKEGQNREMIREAINQAVNEGISWDLELQIVNGSGKDIWVRSIGHPEMTNGQCKRLFGTFQDINEKKTAELEINASRKLLDDILQAASEVSIIATDLDGEITVFNRGAERLLGYSAEEIIGKQKVGIFHLPEELEQLENEIFADASAHAEEDHDAQSKKLFREGFEQKEFTYIRKDGTHRKVSIMGTVIRNAESEIIGYLGIAVDMTTAILQREELKIAMQQAEQANMAKSDFLANMSHEIRTPLNGVIGFTDLVLKTSLTETQLQYLSIVNQSGIALLGIINDILDFSKIEAGKLELDIGKCDIYEIACQATDIITYPIQNKGLEMLLNLSPDLPRFIWTDAIRLKQILINLLGNASKFTESGEVELKIEVLSFTSDQTSIRFEIRDTGIGIPENKQEKIFEAFSQEDYSITKKYGGTGLGLTISNRLLGLMGTHLELESSPGVGSCFHFELNVKSTPGEAVARKDISLVKNALIVDDNDHNRIILTEMLQLKNIKATLAKNGFEALQKLADGGRYDVIIMDYHMPYMDGLETIRKIRESFFSTGEEQAIVLLYSSSDDEKVIKACEELKVHCRLVKPVKMLDLYDTLSRLNQKENNLPAIPVQNTGVQSTDAGLVILIAEDNPINMLLMKTVLRRLVPNVSFLEALNGYEAVVYCEVEAPDLILMDIQMPVMNGYEATTKIRALPQNEYIPIIAVTASSLKSEKKRCIDAGMDDLVMKPFVEKTIFEALNRWLFKKY